MNSFNIDKKIDIEVFLTLINHLKNLFKQQLKEVFSNEYSDLTDEFINKIILNEFCLNTNNEFKQFNNNTSLQFIRKKFNELNII